MYTIAVVDDEMHAVQHMKRLLEACKADCKVTACHTDARLALNDPACVSADILFVDIIMPAMNGLDFAEKLLKLNPFANVILLTAYRDFDFAQRALEIGVLGYWVKHELRKTNIAAKMKAVLESAAEARKKRHGDDRRIFLGGIAENKPLLSIFPDPEEKGQGFLLYINSPDINMDEIPLNSARRCYGTFAVHELRLIAGVVPPGLSAASLISELTEKLPGCSGGLMSRFFPMQTGLRQIHGSLLSAAENCCFPGGRIVQADTEMLTWLQYDMSISRQMEKSIFETAELCAEILDTAGLIRALEPLWSSKYLICGNRQALKYAAKRLDEILNVPGAEAFDMNTAEDVQKLRENFLEKIIRYEKDERGTEARSFKVRKIQAYIRRHLKDDLQLKSLTQEFHISGDYLRKIFKAETGMTLSDYITKARIEEAIRMLKTGDYKVYEIADRIGYKNPHYFSQVFHRETGYYPTEYPLLGEKKQ